MSDGRGGQGVAVWPRACEGGAGMVIWDGVEVRGCRGVCCWGVAGFGLYRGGSGGVVSCSRNFRIG